MTARDDGAIEPELPALLLLVFIFVTTWCTFLLFPGHTYLQSDTQIYVPMLEHLWNSSVLANDIVATRPHVAFTLYDEVALLARWLTGADFSVILIAQQFAYRAVLIAALFWLSRATGNDSYASVTVAAISALGASLLAPAVLTVEYEPVPRGFSLPFLLSSLAAFVYGRTHVSAILASVAFGFHPPTAAAYCGILLITLLMRRCFGASVILLAAPALMLLTMLFSDVPHERQPLLSRIESNLEALQRMRASYNWVSLWISKWAVHYLVLLAGALIGWQTLRASMRPDLRRFSAALIFIGVSSVPVSYVLLEGVKWIAIPQIQPARYLLYVTFFAGFFAASAGALAARRGHWPQAIPWFTFAFLLPLESDLGRLLPPSTELAWRRLLVAALLAALFTSVLTLARGRFKAVALLAAVVPFWVVPNAGEVRNYPRLHSQELAALSDWARTSTEPTSVFQFVGFGRGLEPGVFRAKALRSLYVDWKGGGQVNFLREFAEIWQQRWTEAASASPGQFHSRGVRYLVYKTGTQPAEITPAFQNEAYTVLDLEASSVPNQFRAF